MISLQVNSVPVVSFGEVNDPLVIRQLRGFNHSGHVTFPSVHFLDPKPYPFKTTLVSLFCKMKYFQFVERLVLITPSYSRVVDPRIFHSTGSNIPSRSLPVEEGEREAQRVRDGRSWSSVVDRPTYTYKYQRRLSLRTYKIWIQKTKTVLELQKTSV